MKEPPPPPPSTGIFCYLASLIRGKARPPAEPRSQESDYDSELKKLSYSSLLSPGPARAPSA
ncbi:unnamed protein product [Ixodes pacificus]